MRSVRSMARQEPPREPPLWAWHGERSALVYFDPGANGQGIGISFDTIHRSGFRITEADCRAHLLRLDPPLITVAGPGGLAIPGRIQ